VSARSSAEAVFGLDVNAMLRLTRLPSPSQHRLPNGLNVWLSARLQSRDGATRLFKVPDVPAPAPAAARAEAPAPAAASVPAPAFAIADDTAGTLRDNDRHLIHQTLRGCDGNVSRAARKLGVSRGLVYRHLKQAGTA
jgi:sigma-54 dependent transcriptional regulator, acetoin dehydrogenase operon transcriptional activator AcoR